METKGKQRVKQGGSVTEKYKKKEGKKKGKKGRRNRK